MFVQSRRCQRLVYSHVPILTMIKISYCIRCCFFFPSVMEPIMKTIFGFIKGVSCVTTEIMCVCFFIVVCCLCLKSSVIQSALPVCKASLQLCCSVGKKRLVCLSSTLNLKAAHQLIHSTDVFQGSKISNIFQRFSWGTGCYLFV